MKEKGCGNDGLLPVNRYFERRLKRRFLDSKREVYENEDNVISRAIRIA